MGWASELVLVPYLTLLFSYLLFHLSDFALDARSLNLRRKRYREFESLGSRYVYDAKVIGNCCWEIRERKRFRGQREMLPLGKTGSPPFQPKSARQVACTGDGIRLKRRKK